MLRETRRSLGGVVKQFTVDMKAVSNLSSLKDVMTVFTPAVLIFHQKHHAYKFQFAVDIMFHKAVDGVENDDKVIYPFRISQTIVPGRICCSTSVGVFNTMPLLVTLVDWFATSLATTMVLLISVRSVSIATQLQNCWKIMANCHAQMTKFPQDSRCRFTNVQKQLPAIFVAYADFESILQPVGDDVDVTQGVGVGVELQQLLFKSMFHAVLPSR